jgi:hypothetical protein
MQIAPVPPRLTVPLVERKVATSMFCVTTLSVPPLML